MMNQSPNVPSFANDLTSNVKLQLLTRSMNPHLSDTAILSSVTSAWTTNV